MKKLFVLTAVAGILSLGSCKKNYSCTCDGPGIKDPEVSTWKLKEEDAKANCATLDAVHQEDGGWCALSQQ
jgi:hypothetical protein